METRDSSDRVLLERYFNSGDESAFTELVRRHLPPVRAVALRITGCAATAAEAGQTVFSRLARLQKIPVPELPLIVWLHRAARSVAIDLLRAETRRRRREEAYAVSQAVEAGESFPWERIEPVLDEALDQLPAAERGLILRRFLSGESYAVLAESAGLSEDAARMRVNRALDKLRALLERRGIRTTAAALATGLPAHAAVPVSAGAVTSVSSAALSATAFAAPAASTLSTLVPAALMTSKSAFTAAAVLLLTGGGALMLQRAYFPQSPASLKMPFFTGEAGIRAFSI